MCEGQLFKLRESDNREVPVANLPGEFPAAPIRVGPGELGVQALAFDFQLPVLLQAAGVPELLARLPAK